MTSPAADLPAFLIWSRPGPDPDALPAQVPAHLDYLAELERTGRLVLAGPFSDENGALANEGIMVVRAPDLSAAAELAAGDPFHQCGCRVFEVRRWQIHQGAGLLEQHDRVRSAAGTEPTEEKS